MDMERVEPIFTADAEAPPNPPRGYQSLATVRRKGERDADVDSDDSSWTSDVEEYIRDILKKCEDAESSHNKCAYNAKKNHARFAFPAMLLPTISAPIIGAFKSEEWVPYFAMGSMVATAICNGFSNFFNYGRKSQLHFNFAGRYSDITSDIQECLHKKNEKRISAQLAMRTYKMRIDSLNLSAPEC